MHLRTVTFLLLFALAPIAGVALSPKDAPGEKHTPNADLVEKLKQRQTNSPEEFTKLAGRWTGEHKYLDGRVVEEVSILKRDGSYRFSLTSVEDGKETETYIDEGRWGLVNGIHWTKSLRHTTSTGVVEACRHGDKAYTLYDVLELTDSKFRYRSRYSGKKFVLTRRK